MAKKFELNNTVVLAILLITIGALFLYNKQNVFMSSESDGYFHALGAFFYYDFARWWLAVPTISVKAIESFIISYETQFKFFGGISYYQPFQSLFVTSLAFFMGKSPMAFYMATVLETLGTMFFAYRIYQLLYGKKGNLPFLVILLVAFNPAVFNFAASYSLEPGVMLFTTATVYFFLKFFRSRKKKDMYLMAASIGLGLFTKMAFILLLPILLLSTFAERKIRIFIRNYKHMLISILIILLIIFPWLITEYVFYSMGISKLGERASGVTVAWSPSIPWTVYASNLTGAFLAIFGTVLLIIFLAYKLLKSKIKEGEITLIIATIAYIIFYAVINNPQTRYLTAVVPFAIVLSVRGMEILHSKHKGRIFAILACLTIFVSVMVTFGYTTHEKIIHSSTDMLTPAIYISERSQNSTTVLSTFSRMQSSVFMMIDSKNVNVVEAPYNFSGGEDELQIMLDSKDYVKRPHKPEWEKFGIIHPPIEWVIVHEYYDGLEPDYKLKDIIDKRTDFKLVLTVEGKWPGNRVFVYKRKPSFFY